MKKELYLVIGAILGAAGGSIGTYFALKARFEAERDEAIEEYAEHAEMRLERQIEALKEASVGDLDQDTEETESEEDEDPEDRKINNNEGVKKYHHYDGEQLPEYASKRVFKKVENKPVKESKLVNEITAEEFEQGNEKYTKQTIDVLLRIDDSHDDYWGYQTDNQMTCKAKFGKTLEELFGSEIIEQLLDVTPADEGIGILYFRNNEIMTDFELVLHSDEETYYANEEK